VVQAGWRGEDWEYKSFTTALATSANSNLCVAIPFAAARMDSQYHETTALIAVSGVFLGFGALFLIVVLADIVWRNGWRSMMWIMQVL
jgi:hypothetical protein